MITLFTVPEHEKIKVLQLDSMSRVISTITLNNKIR
jgi:hypothetical protein